MKLKLPKHVDGFVDRTGATRYYFRAGKRRRVPLPGLPWSPTFMAAYEDALRAHEAAKGTIGKDKLIPRSLGELTVLWMRTAGFRDLKPISRKGLAALAKWIQAEHGHRLVTEMRRQHVDKLLAVWADRPSSHNRLLSFLRRLLAHAVTLGWITTSPVQEFRKKKLAGEGYRRWTDAEITTFESHWSLGTVERTAFDLLLQTGQRSADVRAMGWQSVEGGRIVVKQSKTGKVVRPPITAALQRSLETVPRDRLLFVVDPGGKPYAPTTFSNLIRDAAKAAGLDGVSAHGLRKSMACRLAENGATAAEIMSITGHGLKEAEHYIAEVNRDRLSTAGMARLVPIEAGTKFPNSGSSLGNDHS